MTNTIYYWNPSIKEVSSIDKIREENRNASIPDGADISILGYFPLVESEVPSFDRLTSQLGFNVIQKQTPSGIDYVREWFVVELSETMILENAKKFEEELKKATIDFAQNALDNFAKERGYDDIKSAIGYLNSTIPAFKQEAEICLLKRDQTWKVLFDVLAKVQSGELEKPNKVEDLLTYLPELKW